MILAIVFNVLLSIFTVISIPLIIPFFQLLFDRSVEVGGAEADYVTGLFTQLIRTQGKQQALLIVCGLIVGTFFLKNLFRYLGTYVMAPLRTGMVYDIRSELYSKYLHLPLSIIQGERSGDFISRISADVQEVEQSILKIIQVVFKAPLIIVGSIAYMLYLSPQLSLFVLGLLLFTVFIIGGVSRTLKKKSASAQQSLSNIVSQVEETISGQRIIKAFTAETYMDDRFRQENTDYRNTITKLIRRQDLSSPLSEFLGVSIVAVLMYYGSQLVFQNSLVPEAFFAFIFAFYQVIEPAKSFSTAYYNIQKGMAAVDRIDQVAALPSERAQTEGQGVASLDDQLLVQNLTFSYTDGHPVLIDINLAVAAGQTVALVGPSGSGKSTLADLVLGYYGVPRGMISFDGADINDLSLQSIRSLIGLVSQHAILFNDTIRSNITFGQEGATEEEVVAAAKMAHAHEFITALPQGYDTNIGDKGLLLSGGQRQRITIARAILADPDVLILDEATSALDSESEQHVQAALQGLMRDRTALVIAHRLSTIANADQIVVIDQGNIIAQGRHDELIVTSPLYKKYVQMQTFDTTE